MQYCSQENIQIVLYENPLVLEKNKSMHNFARHFVLFVRAVAFFCFRFLVSAVNPQPRPSLLVGASGTVMRGNLPSDWPLGAFPRNHSLNFIAIHRPSASINSNKKPIL